MSMSLWLGQLLKWAPFGTPARADSTPGYTNMAEILLFRWLQGALGFTLNILMSPGLLRLRLGREQSLVSAGISLGEGECRSLHHPYDSPGTDALSPAPQHDIYSIEDLTQLIYALKEATNYAKPVSVKIAAVHNSAAIASGMVRAGADIIVLDGLRGATGAAPKVIRDNVGIPIELALASVDSRLRQEGIRNQASIVVSGGIRNSGDVAKAIALGADAVYIGTAAFDFPGLHCLPAMPYRQVRLGYLHH